MFLSANCASRRLSRRLSLFSQAASPVLEKLEIRRLLSAGDPDQSFGNNGIVNDDPSGIQASETFAITAQTDNHLIVGGVSGSDSIVVRYNLDGSRDASFGNDGVYDLSIGNDSQIDRVAIDPGHGNAIVAMGTVDLNTGTDFFVTRLLPNGTPDPTYGNGTGIEIIDNNSDTPLDMALRPDGAVVVAGSDYVSQLLPDGSGLDLSWGQGGTASEGLEGLSITSVGVNTNGSVIVGGTVQNEFNGSIPAAERLDATGNVDSSFGTSGLASVDNGGADGVSDLAIDGTGNIYLAGLVPLTDSASNEAMSIYRFTAAGQLDTSYGDNGLATASIDGFDLGAQSIVIDHAGRAVITGSGGATDLSPNFIGATARFLPNGSLDSDFGGGVVATTENTDFPDVVATLGNDQVAITGPNSDGGYFIEQYGSAAVNNPPPVANAGPDQTGNEGDTLTFDGSGSTGDGLTYTWDFGDGHQATGETVQHTYADNNPGNAPFTVTLTVTDGNEQTSSDTAQVTIDNVDPSVGAINGPGSSVRQQSDSFSGSFTDPGTQDTHTVSWNFGDGNVIAYHPDTDSGALTPSHVYTTAGTFTVTLSVMDKDGGVGTQTTSVTVSLAAIQGGNLIVGGTEAADTIAIKTAASGSQVKVYFGGVLFGQFAPTGHIIVYGGGGDDTITVAGGVTMNVEAYGQAGNDTITGGGGNDSLDGGDGADSLDGNAGNDSLTGDAGNDTLVGNAGNDSAYGGDGDDSIVNNNGDDLLDGGNGNDTLIAGGGADVATGDAGNDSITGGDGNDTLDGGADNDTILGNAGDDYITGGTGNDSLNGGAGNDIVVGGDGADSIDGGADRDILIGGTGTDNVTGNADDDILVAGTTDYDANPTALFAIQAEWVGPHSFTDRVNNILNGSGAAPRANGSFFFNPGGPTPTVHDDAAVDTLTGSSGSDWFLFNSDSGVMDIITDLKAKQGDLGTDIS